MTSYGKTVTHRPVDDDEAQTHHHEGYAQRSKADSLGRGGRSNTGAQSSATTRSVHKWDGVVGWSYQDLRSGAHGFFVFGNNTDVEDSGENENEARS